MANNLSPNSIVYRSEIGRSSKLDIDQCKILYTIEYRDISVRLSSPLIRTAELFKFLLLHDSEIVRLDARYYQRPDLLSYDKYGTERLDWLLLFINNVFAYEDFILDEVYVPYKNTVYTVFSNYAIPTRYRKETVEVEE